MKDIIKVVGITLLLVLILLIDDFLLPSPLLHPYKWYLLPFFFVLAGITTYLTNKNVDKDASLFQGFFFGSMLLRMMLSLGIIFWFIKQGVQDKASFIITFFVLYFAYVFVEIYTLFQRLMQQKMP